MKKFNYLVLLLLFLIGFQTPIDAFGADCRTKIAPRRADGGILLKAHTRGKAPFTYEWSNGAKTQSIKVKEPGKYCVKVEDAEGCVSDACFVVRKPGDGDDVKCRTRIMPRRTDAGLKLIARTRGKAPFTYHWSTGDTTQSIVVKEPGKYCVKVEDAEGCISKTCFELRKPGDGDDAKCRTRIMPRRTDKGVKLTARTRGKAPFKYHWSTGDTTQSIVVKEPGKYCVKVEDAEGCISKTCFELRKPGDGDDAKCRTRIMPRRTDKGVKLTARTRGKAPFKYHWSTGDTTQSIVVKEPGKYCVKVEDAEGCISKTCFDLRKGRKHHKRAKDDDSVDVRAWEVDENPYIRDINVFPVPVSDRLNVVIDGSIGVPVMVEITDMEGRSLLNRQAVTNEEHTVLEMSVSQLNPGQYLLRVTSTTSSKIRRFVKL